MEWVCAKESKPTVGEFVLVWDTYRKNAAIAKWSGKFWKASPYTIKKELVSHWAQITGPDGQKPRQPHVLHDSTSADSQDNSSIYLRDMK